MYCDVHMFGGASMTTKSAQYLPPQNKQQLVVAWIRRAREAQFCHYESANIYSARDKWLGIPVIIITTVIGTSVFASSRRGYWIL